MLGAKLDAMQDHAKSHGTGTFTATLTGSKLSWHLAFKGLTGAASRGPHPPRREGQGRQRADPALWALHEDRYGHRELNAMQVRDLTKLATYVNVHTAKYPNGEIRGQMAAG